MRRILVLVGIMCILSFMVGCTDSGRCDRIERHRKHDRSDLDYLISTATDHEKEIQEMRGTSPVAVKSPPAPQPPEEAAEQKRLKGLLKIKEAELEAERKDKEFVLKKDRDDATVITSRAFQECMRKLDAADQDYRRIKRTRNINLVSTLPEEDEVAHSKHKAHNNSVAAMDLDHVKDQEKLLERLAAYYGFDDVNEVKRLRKKWVDSR